MSCKAIWLKSLDARNIALLKGIFSGMALKVLVLISPLLLIPIFLKSLGPENFGLWMTVVSILAMTGFLDLGLGNSLLTRLPPLISSNLRNEINRELNSSYLIMMIVGLAMLILILFGLIYSEKITVREYVIYSPILGLALSLPSGLILKVLSAIQKTHYSNYLQAFAAMSSAVICILMHRNGVDIRYIVFTYSVMQPVIMAVATVYIYKNIKIFSVPNITKIDKCVTKKQLIMGIQFVSVTSILSVAMNNDNAIIASIYGLQRVSDYSIPARIGSIFLSLISFMALPMWAAYGDAKAKGDNLWIASNAKKYSQIAFLIFMLSALILCIAAPKIVYLWTGLHLPDSTMIVFGFGLTAAFMAGISPYFMILNSSGELKIQIYIFAVFLGVSLPIKYLVCVFMGEKYLPLATAFLYFIFVVIPVYIKTNNQIHLRINNQGIST